MRVFERTKTLDLKKEKPNILLQLQRNSSELDEADGSVKTKNVGMHRYTPPTTTDNYRQPPRRVFSIELLELEQSRDRGHLLESL
jgi:hypothetical protein